MPKNRQLGEALERAFGALALTCAQQRKDAGVERRHGPFERRLDVGKRLCRFDPDVLDLDRSGRDGEIGHYDLTGGAIGSAAARASRITAWIFCGVSGMSRCAMSSGESASSTGTRSSAAHRSRRFRPASSVASPPVQGVRRYARGGVFR
jgi:hypothetical protein